RGERAALRDRPDGPALPRTASGPVARPRQAIDRVVVDARAPVVLGIHEVVEVVAREELAERELLRADGPVAVVLGDARDDRGLVEEVPDVGFEPHPRP